MHPLQILVNYWEIRPGQMARKLDHYVREGVQEIFSFVPWKAVEADISHQLTKFLVAAADCELKVSLVITPEVAVSYPYSGLPRDLALQKRHAAIDSRGKPVISPMAPALFRLPSLHDPELSKRFQGFLLRLENLFADLSRTEPRALSRTRILVSGSFWKYYRPMAGHATAPFSGTAGERGPESALAFRQEVGRLFARSEFADPGSGSVNRWKSRAMESLNRLWFDQLSEDLYRSRTERIACRRAGGTEIEQVDVFAPEADPSLSLGSLLQLVSGDFGDFHALSRLLGSVLARTAACHGRPCPPMVHWSGVGSFRSLSDSERQFLILKSLLLAGARGGAVVVDEAEWFSLSQAFRGRVEGLARALARGELSLERETALLLPHLWSDAGDFGDELQKRCGPGLAIYSSLEALIESAGTKLLAVDPANIVTRETLTRLLSWVGAGRWLALPRSALFTDSAKEDLEAVLRKAGSSERSRVLRMEIGFPYQVIPEGRGRVVLFDAPPAGERRGERVHSWAVFTESLLSMAEVQPLCAVADGRLDPIVLQGRDGASGVFILNGTGRTIASEIRFPCEVRVSDLAVSLAVEPAIGGRRGDRGGAESGEGGSERIAREYSDSYSIDAPPCGILPLEVRMIGDSATESRLARETDCDLEESVELAATSELPGFREGGPLWS